MPLLNFNVFNICMLFAGLQGILLAILLLSAKKYRKASNYALAILLISTSGILLRSSLRIIYFESIYIKYIYGIPVMLPTLLAVSCYFFIQYLIEPNHKMTRGEKLLGIPVLVQFAFNAYLYWTDIFNQSNIENSPLFSDFSFLLQDIFDVLFTLFIFIVSMSKLNKYEYHLLNSHSSIENKSLKWIKNILYLILFLWFLFASLLIYNWTHEEFISFYPLWMGMGILIYCGGYLMYLKRDVFEVIEFIEPIVELESKSKLSDNTTLHFDKLLQVMSDEQLFLDPNLNLTLLSEKLGISSGYLSRIINQKTGKNFFDFINEYRVKEVKKRLLDPDCAHFSILGIALDAGFKSKSTFNSVFKRIAGETPSSYRKKQNIAV